MDAKKQKRKPNQKWAAWLPIALLKYILTYATPLELHTMQRVCKDWRLTPLDCNRCWKDLYMRDWACCVDDEGQWNRLYYNRRQLERNWTMGKFQRRRQVDLQGAVYADLVYSGKHQELYVACQNGRVLGINPTTAMESKHVDLPLGRLLSMENWNETLLLCGCQRGIALLTLPELRPLCGHLLYPNQPVNWRLYLPEVTTNGQLVLAISEETGYGILIWDLETGRLVSHSALPCSVETYCASVYTEVLWPQKSVRFVFQRHLINRPCTPVYYVLDGDGHIPQDKFRPPLEKKATSSFLDMIVCPADDEPMPVFEDDEEKEEGRNKWYLVDRRNAKHKSREACGNTILFRPQSALVEEARRIWTWTPRQLAIKVFDQQTLEMVGKWQLPGRPVEMAASLSSLFFVLSDNPRVIQILDFV